MCAAMAGKGEGSKLKRKNRMDNDKSGSKRTRGLVRDKTTPKVSTGNSPGN